MSNAEKVFWMCVGVVLLSCFIILVGVAKANPLERDIPEVQQVVQVAPDLVLYPPAGWTPLWSPLHHQVIEIRPIPPRKAYNLLQWGCRAPIGTFGFDPAPWERR